MSGSEMTMDHQAFADAMFRQPDEHDLHACRYTLTRLHGADAVRVLADLLTPAQMHAYSSALESDMETGRFLRITEPAVRAMVLRLDPATPFTDAEMRVAEHLASPAFGASKDVREFARGLRPDSPAAPAIEGRDALFYRTQARLLLSTRLPLARVFRALFGQPGDPYAAEWHRVEPFEPSWSFPMMSAVWENSPEGRETLAACRFVPKTDFPV